MSPNITKILILCAVILVGYLIYIKFFDKHNENSVDDQKEKRDETVNSSTEHFDSTSQNDSSGQTDSDDQNTNNNEELVVKKLINKLTSPNSAKSEPKLSNYNNGVRGNAGNSEWAQFFDHGSDLTSSFNNYKNDSFLPNEEGPDHQSNTKLYAKKQEKPDEIFNVDKLLPQDIREDWFDVMPEPVSVKNRHLVNIVRPIGVNTIGASLRNPSLDFRGSPPCPKFVASPWLNSTIEPDINIKTNF